MNFSIKNNLLSYLDGTSGVSFAMKLEKHLDDVKKGRGEISKDTAQFLGEKETAAGSALAKLNPKLFSQYENYSTAFSYNKRARFVNGIADTVRMLNAII